MSGNTSATQTGWISFDQYEAEEREREIRHEYLGGRCYAMSGASGEHNLIAGNLYIALRLHHRGETCRVYQENMLVKFNWGPHIYGYYPDVMVCCDTRDYGPKRYICEHPCLIVEVSSPSTIRMDREEKRRAYQQIPSLMTYVMVEQTSMSVTLHRRRNEWQPEIFTAAEDLITLDCGAPHLPLSISLAAIYESVLDS